MSNIYTNIRCFIENRRNLTHMENREYLKHALKMSAL